MFVSKEALLYQWCTIIYEIVEVKVNTAAGVCIVESTQLMRIEVYQPPKLAVIMWNCPN